MSLEKYIDSLYGELSLKATGEDAGITPEVLRAKPLKTRTRIRLARIAVSSFPNTTERILNYPYQRKGYDVVGYGFHSTVLRDDKEVLKVMRRSAGEDDGWRDAKVLDLSERQKVAAEYISNYILRQTFSNEKHPLYSHRKVIISRQTMVEYEKFNISSIFDQDSEGRHVEQMHTFGAKSLDMHNEIGLVPDILGSDNLVLCNDQLTLLDSVPISQSDNSNSYSKILNLLERIAKA